MITIEALHNFPKIEKKFNLSAEIIKTIQKEAFTIHNNDVLCIASKLISKSEGLFVDLNSISPSQLALRLHQQIPRKDPRLIQIIIDQTSDKSGKKLQTSKNFIGGWLPNGLFLTSAGVDKIDAGTAIVLPKNCDEIAKRISDDIFNQLKVRVAIIITDSDGRIDKKGATQVAVGLYGISGLRKSQHEDKTNVETICDMLAASAGLLMGQKGKMLPIVKIHGIDYTFDKFATIRDAVN
ncbi:glutamate ligase [Lactobacillus crispatus]|uniref:Glutamate ligase n=1 Tax=Lactobacillus crispatus TaxID=47770 RepID=A0A2M9WMY5_9LACO|nr:coenzyme F420-0:L-glutamate ligase [Lactobacillus crispatus]MBW0437858.1 coenzyme F420-0:L-glutamate ligase [Lactobacillus crispatus]MBW0444881.1 coenzyme F420-0:L-glutamate ligase [Lactobacillus crispatus]MBW0456696.1 coenzyme F420-0:L-glutamate ligase [Lactobacillus crispatus]MDK6665011.1 coenzyme F420-0:L-glutamate ligase [Lactobacillus crispatus]MDT9610307.1 coenzyme F420-0:L-glutamate ligase [Lactobacillus crispatus]